MVQFRTACISALVAGVLALAASAAAADVVYPSGLRIGLEPPGDTKLSTRFPGFEDADRKVVITMLDLPAAAYADVESSFFAKNQTGIEDLKRESFAFGGGLGFLATGRAKKDGVTVHKWLLFAKAVSGPVQNLTALVNIDVPEAARAVYTDAVIRKALASVTFRPAPIEEQLGLLPFELTERAGFRVMQVLPTGGAVLTDGPSDDVSKQPFMIVSIGRGAPVQADDRGRFARDLLSSVPVRDLAVRSAESMRIANGPGYEIRATAKGPSGDALSLVQWVRFGTGGFLRVIGVGHADAWDALFPRFRAVRDGVDFR